MGLPVKTRFSRFLNFQRQDSRPFKSAKLFAERSRFFRSGKVWAKVVTLVTFERAFPARVTLTMASRFAFQESNRPSHTTIKAGKSFDDVFPSSDPSPISNSPASCPKAERFRSLSSALYRLARMAFNFSFVSWVLVEPTSLLCSALFARGDGGLHGLMLRIVPANWNWSSFRICSMSSGLAVIMTKSPLSCDYLTLARHNNLEIDRRSRSGISWCVGSSTRWRRLA